MTKVTIQRDICLNLIVPLTATHNFIPLPPYPPTPPPLPAAPLSLAACAIESLVNAWWPPGFALGANKFTTSVFHFGLGICLDGHDCGKLIPHVQVAPAPNNTLTITQVASSSRKCNFTASTVKFNGKSVACMTFVSWPPTPMTYCSEPMSMPLGDAVTAYFNTVDVGMTWQDWVAGAFAVAAGMILEWALFKAKGGTKDFGQNAGKMIAQSRAGRTTFQLVAGDLIGDASFKAGSWFAKQGVGILTGAVRIGLTGEGEMGVSHSIGGPFLELKVGASVSRDNATDEWSGKAGASGQAGTLSGNLDTDGAGIAHNHPLGVGSESHSHKWGEGTTSTTTELEPFNGLNNRTTTQRPDGTTTVVESQGGSSLSNPL
jgi:hypothetical protein